MKSQLYNSIKSYIIKNTDRIVINFVDREKQILGSNSKQYKAKQSSNTFKYIV